VNVGPRIIFCYRYGLLGGVSAQLLNRYPYLSAFLDVSVLYEQDYGMASRFPRGAAQVTSTVAAQTAAIRQLRPDITVVIDSPGFVEAWRAAGALGKLVLEVHTTTANVGYLRHPEQFAEVAHIVTVSSYMEELLRAHDLHRLAPISVVPNCLDDRWREPSQGSELDGEPVVWVGKLDSHKRWRTAVDLIDQLAEAPDLRVLPVLIGGMTSPASEVEALTTRLATSTGLARGVWYPRVEYDRMPGLYSTVGRSRGVQVCTSLNESFGMAVAESVLRGCPVVAPAVGALPELLPAAALYPPDDWATAYAKAHRAMVDTAFREEMLSSVAHVRELTRPERVVEAYRSVVASVLNDAPREDAIDAGRHL
jgi:glycosyltransferase involved in cell wall biosynthesis